MMFIKVSFVTNIDILLHNGIINVENPGRRGHISLMSAAKTVLIIEDEIDIQHFIARVLELEGYGVLRAGDGNTGLALLREHPVSLVLLDLRLPGLDGWSVLREIKRNPDLSAIPVIVLTAIAEAMQRKKTLRMGAVKYLVKPLSASSLSRTIAGVLRQKGKQLQIAVRSAASSAKISSPTI
jgi:DNA-binding response OmpR family regulator